MDFKAEWIAPNSKFFRQLKDGLIFSAPSVQMVRGEGQFSQWSPYVYLNELKPGYDAYKVIAAAVAIEEWQTEIKRLTKEYYLLDDSAGALHYISSRIVETGKIIDAIRNWRDKAAS